MLPLSTDAQPHLHTQYHPHPLWRLMTTRRLEYMETTVRFNALLRTISTEMNVSSTTSSRCFADKIGYLVNSCISDTI